MNSKVDIDKGSFIKVLSETNAHYNVTYRRLICTIIPPFLSISGGKVKDNVRWTLFKLLQFHTTEIQQDFSSSHRGARNRIMRFQL